MSPYPVHDVCDDREAGDYREKSQYGVIALRVSTQQEGFSEVCSVDRHVYRCVPPTLRPRHSVSQCVRGRPVGVVPLPKRHWREQGVGFVIHRDVGFFVLFQRDVYSDVSHSKPCLQGYQRIRRHLPIRFNRRNVAASVVIFAVVVCHAGIRVVFVDYREIGGVVVQDE